MINVHNFFGKTVKTKLKNKFVNQYGNSLCIQTEMMNTKA